MNRKNIWPLVIVALAAAVVGVVLGWLVPSNAWGAIGGLGSAVGGLAAAVAAWRSWDAARASDASVAKMEQIARDSRIALGRAMTTKITPYIRLAGDSPWLRLDVDQAWPALDPLIVVKVPGRNAEEHRLQGDLRSLPGTLNVRLPEPPENVQQWLTLRRGSEDELVLQCVVVIQFTDRDRILRHQNEYLINALVAPIDGSGTPKFVKPLRAGKLFHQSDWFLSEKPPLS